MKTFLMTFEIAPGIKFVVTAEAYTERQAKDLARKKLMSAMITTVEIK